MRLQWTWFSSVRIRRNARAPRSSWHGYLHPSGMVTSLVCPSHILRMQRMHVALHCFQVHPAHHALKHIHVIHVEMPQPFIPKLQKIPSKCAKELVSAPFVTFMCNWYKLDSNDATAKISLLLAFTTHPNKLKSSWGHEAHHAF